MRTYPKRNDVHLNSRQVVSRKVMRKVKGTWIAVAVLGLAGGAQLAPTVYFAQDVEAFLVTTAEGGSSFANKEDILADEALQAEVEKAKEAFAAIEDPVTIEPNALEAVQAEIKRQKDLGLPAYVVQVGDTMEVLAEAASLTVEEISTANGLAEDAELVPGDILNKVLGNGDNTEAATDTSVATNVVGRPTSTSQVVSAGNSEVPAPVAQTAVTSTASQVPTASTNIANVTTPATSSTGNSAGNSVTPGTATPTVPSTEVPSTPTPVPSEAAPADPTPVDPTPVDPIPVDPTPVDPIPVDPTPVDPIPVDPTPVDPIPVDPTPVDPIPVDPTPVDPIPVDPTPVDPAPVDPIPVDPTPVDPTPVDPTPVDPTPVDPRPVDPTPVDPAPVDPTPVDPTPVDPTPVDPAPVDPTPVDPTPVDPTPVDPAPVDPTPVDPTPVAPTPVDPTPAPSQTVAQQIADNIVRYSNILRGNNGLAPMVVNNALQQAAEKNVAYLISRGVLEHDMDNQNAIDSGYARFSGQVSNNSTGSVIDRPAMAFANLGFATLSQAELTAAEADPSIAQALGEEYINTLYEDGGLSSKGHRYQMLAPSWSETGAATQYDPATERLYYVQYFGTPEESAYTNGLSEQKGIDPVTNQPKVTTALASYDAYLTNLEAEAPLYGVEAGKIRTEVQEARQEIDEGMVIVPAADVTVAQ
ncbi:hypothetical protein CL176_01030 [Suicoccus acidiformans]|uniref:LysM domain-containing protein n=1 Tax=Suicoccus acidiformans TaxID=2036206 RepID=A0A347WI16_9LACT|nr:CAP domain-containing protein [Suicoccus acidiformans]AXY24723.1 hypothetical protein CL176_01030 [Suicoccus acidiformans]